MVVYWLFWVGGCEEGGGGGGGGRGIAHLSNCFDIVMFG